MAIHFCTCEISNEASDKTFNSPTPAVVHEDICGARAKAEDADGFDIPSVPREGKKAVRTLSRTYSGKTVTETTFETKDPEIANFDVPERVFGLSGPTWILKHRSDYAIGDNTFQVAVAVSRKMVPVIIMFVYTDTDGDGSFDLVCQREGLELPTLPDWVRKP